MRTPKKLTIVSVGKLPKVRIEKMANRFYQGWKVDQHHALTKIIKLKVKIAQALRV